MIDYAIGVDLGGTRIKTGLVHREKGLIHQLSLDTGAASGPSHVISQIGEGIRTMLSLVPQGQIDGIGIGSPGVISWDRTTVSLPPNFPGWTVMNLKDEFQALFGTNLPVIVENDANVAGLGSAFFGAGRPFESFIMVTLGTGVGGGIIYQKRIFRGMTGGAAEIGHMTIDYEGPRARSGVPGAVEAYLGQRFLSRHARYHLLNRHESLVHQMTGGHLESITPKMIHDAALAGDQAAQEVLAWAGHKLGCVVGSAINLLDIRKVVVGGGVAAAGEFILEPARRSMYQFVVPGLREGLELVQETLGNEVGILGAARLVFEYHDEYGPVAPPP